MLVVSFVVYFIQFSHLLARTFILDFGGGSEAAASTTRSSDKIQRRAAVVASGVEQPQAVITVERAPLLGGAGSMLAEAEPSLSPPGLSSAVANPLPLAAQLSRLEDAHRGGVSAASLEGGAAGLPGSGAAPPPLLPPRTRGALYEAAMSSVAASDALDAGYAGDDGTPQGRTACTASCLAPCAKLNGNVATLYRCGSRDARAWPWLCQWGPDWPCNIGTFMFILGPTIPFQALVAWRISIWVSLAGVVVALAALTTLCLTALSDPGYLVKQSKAQLEAQRRSMEEQGLTGTFTVCRACARAARTRAR